VIGDVSQRAFVRGRQIVNFDRQNGRLVVKKITFLADTVYLGRLIDTLRQEVVCRNFENCASRAYLLRDSSRIGDIESSSIRTFGELASPKLISSLIAD